MLNLTMTPKKVVAVMAPEATMPVFGYALQLAVEWFLGHGVGGFSLIRKTQTYCTLEVEAMGTPKPLAFSKVATLGTLANQGYISKKMAPWEPKQFEAIDRIERISTKEAGEILMRGQGLRLETTVAEFAYGLSEWVSALMVLGATQARHQISVDFVQTWANIGMTGEQLVKFQQDPVSYNPYMLVRDMPITFNPNWN